MRFYLYLRVYSHSLAALYKGIGQRVKPYRAVRIFCLIVSSVRKELIIKSVDANNPITAYISSALIKTSNIALLVPLVFLNKISFVKLSKSFDSVCYIW